MLRHYLDAIAENNSSKGKRVCFSSTKNVSEKKRSSGEAVSSSESSTFNIHIEGESTASSEIISDASNSFCQLMVESPTIKNITTMRANLRDFVESTCFQIFIGTLVVTNALLIGISTFDFVSKNESASVDFEKLSTLFLVVFTIELCFNVFAYGIRFLEHPWLLFDASIIIPCWFTSEVQPLRALRILRLFKVFRYAPSLRRISTALMSTGPEMTSVMVFLVIIFYIFAVIFTQLFGDCYDMGCYCVDYPTCEEGLGVNYFGRLDYTFFTLFMLMTFDDWAEVIRMTQRRYPWACFLLIFFVMISAFVMLNLVVAVLCDALNKIREDEAKLRQEREEGNNNKLNRRTVLASLGESVKNLYRGSSGGGSFPNGRPSFCSESNLKPHQSFKCPPIAEESQDDGFSINESFMASKSLHSSKINAATTGSNSNRAPDINEKLVNKLLIAFEMERRLRLKEMNGLKEEIKDLKQIILQSIGNVEDMPTGIVG